MAVLAAGAEAWIAPAGGAKLCSASAIDVVRPWLSPRAVAEEMVIA